MTSKGIGVLVVCGILGAAYCLAAGTVASALGLIPDFPAYGGERDFELRLMIFLAGVLPSFVAIGVVVGRISISNRRASWRALLGASVGTVLTLVSGGLLTSVIEHLPSRSSSNGAVVAFFGVWILLTVAGVLLAIRRSADNRSEAQPG